MTATHDTFDELAAVYAVGALDGADREHLEAHLRAGCLDCERALRDWRETLAQEAENLRAAPPARVKQALMRRLDGGRPARGVRIWLRVGTGMALAAGIAAAAVGLRTRAAYEARLSAVASEVARLREDLGEQRELLALLRAPGTRVVRLAGLTPSPKAEARIVWHEERGGLLLADGLPPVPAGRTYELWAIAGGKPRPAGLFTVDAAGAGLLKVAAQAGQAPVEQFAVTLEPAGGVPAPTGAMYLASPAAS